jgi:hypothetical protein
MTLVAYLFDSYSPALATASAFSTPSLQEARPAAYAPPPGALSTAALSSLAAAVNAASWACRNDAPAAAGPAADPYEPPTATAPAAAVSAAAEPRGKAPAGGAVSAPAVAATAAASAAAPAAVGGLAARGGLLWQHLYMLAAPAVGCVAGLRHSGVARRGLSRHPRLEPKRPR